MLTPTVDHTIRQGVKRSRGVYVRFYVRLQFLAGFGTVLQYKPPLLVMPRSTSQQLDEREQAALHLLEDVSPASAVRLLAKKYEVSPRQARRYVKKALLESFDAPLATDELGFSIANNMERLERIADAAASEGDRKTEIAATRAAIQAAENRLKAIQRSDEHHRRLTGPAEIGF